MNTNTGTHSAGPTGTTYATHESVVVRHLQAEWDTLNTAGIGADTRAISQWLPARLINACTTLDDVLDLIATSTPTRQDTILKVLLRASQAGDPIAARVLVQSFLPVLLTHARRVHLESCHSHDEQIQTVLAEFWEVVHSPATTKATTKIASRLSLDTLKRVTRPHRVQSDPDAQWATLIDPTWTIDDLATETPTALPTVDPAPLPAHPHDTPDADSTLTEILTWALHTHVLDQASVQLLAQIHLAERTREDLATELGISRRALGRRLDHATATLTTALRTTSPAAA